MKASRPPKSALDWLSRFMVKVLQPGSDHVGDVSSAVAPAAQEVQNMSDGHV